LLFPIGNHSVGWIDTRDLAEVAAEALRYPKKYENQRIWLSTEALSGKDIAKIITEETGKQWDYQPVDVEVLKKPMIEEFHLDPAYLDCILKFFSNVAAGKLTDIADVFPDVVPSILGRKPYTIRDSIREYKSNLSE